MGSQFLAPTVESGDFPFLDFRNSKSWRTRNLDFMNRPRLPSNNRLGSQGHILQLMKCMVFEKFTKEFSIIFSSKFLRKFSQSFREIFGVSLQNLIVNLIARLLLSLDC